MQKYISLLAFLISLNVLAVGTVRFADDDTVQVSARDSGAGSTFTLISSDPSGDGTSSSSPGVAYLPIDDSTSEDHITIADKTLVPDTTNGRIYIQLDVVNNTGSTAFLYAAAEDDDGNNYLIVEKYGSIANGTNAEISLEIELSKLCQSEEINTCSDFIDTQANDTKDLKIYFFMDSNSSYNDTGSSTIDVTDSNSSGGVYLDLRLSDDVIDDAVSSVTVDSVRRGDGQLLINYTGTSVSDLNAIYALYGTSTFGTTSDTANSAIITGGVTKDDLNVTSPDGQVFLRNLTNGTNYFVRLIFENKFQFATRISTEGSGSPLEIEEILESESCYIISAGFQESHYIVDYFKLFRDKILKNFAMGRSFINFYYKTAPDYATYIFKNPILSFFVRIFAYCLFFVMNLCLLGCGVVAIILLRSLLRILIKGFSFVPAR